MPKMKRRRQDPRGFDPGPLRTEGGNALEIEGPFGWRGKARGPLVIVVILALAIIGASGYFWWRAERTTRDAMTGHETMGAERRQQYRQDYQRDHEAIVSGIRELVEQQRVQTYILSLPEPRRRELGLDEPEELRRLRSTRGTAPERRTSP